MAEKKLTPIQEALKEIDSWLEWCKGKRSVNEANDVIEGKESVCMDLRNHLQSLLLKEKEFAKDMYNHGVNDYALEHKDDFNSAFKQYEP